jgi:putative ABC transport system permease protein
MVAVIGSELARILFPWDDPVGKVFRIDDKAFTVVGVLAPVGLAGGRGAILIGRDLNLDVHVPLTTVRAVFSDLVVKRVPGSFQATEVQISEVYLSVPDRDRVLTDAARAERIIDTRHTNAPDVAMIVPYELLASARRSAMSSNIMLGAIASISLLVGGIGIMNIMLATVTERTREIGVRRALGATRRHIIWQFLVETGVLSTIGGLVGVGLGICFAYALEMVVPLLPRMPLVGQYFNVEAVFPTQVTLWSIIIAFCVAVMTGLVFGIYPARKAAQQDPIVALRHD